MLLSLRIVLSDLSLSNVGDTTFMLLRTVLLYCHWLPHINTSHAFIVHSLTYSSSRFLLYVFKFLVTQVTGYLPPPVTPHPSSLPSTVPVSRPLVLSTLSLFTFYLVLLISEDFTCPSTSVLLFHHPQLYLFHSPLYTVFIICFLPPGSGRGMPARRFMNHLLFLRFLPTGSGRGMPARHSMNYPLFLRCIPPPNNLR